MFRWVDHTAELELHIEARSEEDVFSEALAALAELLGEALGGEIARRRLDLHAPDRATLLVEWLEELVFLSEADGFLPERAIFLALSQQTLSAAVAGRLGQPRHLVKAVTLHGLAFGFADGAWRAQVVLDV